MYDHAQHEGGPILLFDGVCNLCDASVQFVLDRDRKKVFRFAALQSEAASAALQRAGVTEELPDSVVVIDERGVHTRSDAALAVLRRLGFPWSLLLLGQFLPRAIRDTLYAWIARNRYRWFGRQHACRVPTPELRARFLDADEPTRPAPVATTAPLPPPGLGLGTIPHRFLLIYPLVFMLPFPLTLLSLLAYIPGYSDSLAAVRVNEMIDLHRQATEPLISWLGVRLTGEVPSFEFTGSGDTLANYLGVLVDLCVTAVIVLLWWAWRRARPVSPRFTDACHVLIRYYVAYVMLSYGFSKVFPLQFAPMGPDRLLQPYGDSSPMGLLWTFMGASTGYQMFAGAGEVVGGLLLLFRRTALLGALVVAGVMTNVFAMNLFFDVPVKLYSFHYLAFAVLVGLPDVPRMIGLFVANIPVAPRDLRPFWRGSRAVGILMGTVKLVLVIALVWSNVDARLERMRTSGPWAQRSELLGVYRVESFEVLASETEMPPVPWARVGLKPPWTGTIMGTDGTARRMRLRLDEEAATVALFDRSLLEPDAPPMQLERMGDDRIRLTGMFEEASIAVTLQREEQGSLFLSRGFRWISPYPFNR